MEFAILVYDGFDDLDAFGPFEVFSHAQGAGADIECGLYTLETAETVETAHGLTVEPDGTMPDDPAVVVVPGGGWSTDREASVRGEYERGEIPDALVTYHEQGAVIASVCTGAMLLAKAGLTDGRRAVTHHTALADLDASGAEVVDQRVVDAGDVVTAGGITSGIDLALALVEREFGAEIAKRVAKTMEYSPHSSCIE